MHLGAGSAIYQGLRGGGEGRAGEHGQVERLGKVPPQRMPKGLCQPFWLCSRHARPPGLQQGLRSSPG